MDLMNVDGRRIGPGEPTFVIAELSANHNQDLSRALELIHVARDAGADAIKVQTYTPDTMTIDCDGPLFRVGGGSLWEGRNLYELYGEAQTPWEWQPELKRETEKLGLVFFSTPFDLSSVDFLEQMDVSLYKVASFEVIDIPLLKRIGKTGKPVIMSTGMATLSEIDTAVTTLREAGTPQLALLKCTSAYPAPASEMNLRTIPHLAEAFSVPVGLSDHTLDLAVPVAAVAVGACILEKHLAMSRQDPGPDSAFSLEPHEFKAMVDAVRTTEQALGRVHYGVGNKEMGNRVFRRSLFVVADLRAGDVLAPENVRSIRPGHGLAPAHLEVVVGKQITRDTPRGTPLTWDLVGAPATE